MASSRDGYYRNFRTLKQPSNRPPFVLVAPVFRLLGIGATGGRDRMGNTTFIQSP